MVELLRLLDIFCFVALAVGLMCTPCIGGTRRETVISAPTCATLRYGKINLRAGPGFRYPIEWVLHRRGLPVHVKAKYHAWRKIRLFDGTTGWVHERVLSKVRAVLIVGAARTMRAHPSAAARPVARADVGVIARVISCDSKWCEVEAADLRGWIQRRSVWGLCSDS